jgi:putative addiction module killer protein
VFRLFRTDDYEKWFDGLRDRRAAARVAIRVARLAEGNAGDTKSVGGGVMEMRIDYGPGYRVYYTRRGLQVLLLLIGGDKTTQAKDIQNAKLLSTTWEIGE